MGWRGVETCMDLLLLQALRRGVCLLCLPPAHHPDPGSISIFPVRIQPDGRWLLVTKKLRDDKILAIKKQDFCPSFYFSI